MEGVEKKLVKNKEETRFYKLKLIWFRIKHGLILYSALNLLKRLGIEINPYWIDEEGLNHCKEPAIRDDDAGLYSTGPLDKDVVIDLYRSLDWDTSDLLERLKSDYHGVGLYRKQELTAFMLIKFDSFYHKSNPISLRGNEAYLENMYTYERFRGKNLAPYLRYQCYKMLANEGKTTCYSITQVFNKSSRKFKSKLHAVHRELWLQLGLFKKYRWNFLLKRYPDS